MRMHILILVLTCIINSNAFSNDHKLATATCMAGFAESPRNWSSDYFIPKCKEIISLPEAICVAGFAASDRNWSSSLFNQCKEVLSIAEATCIAGFAKSPRNWNSKWFFPECKSI